MGRNGNESNCNSQMGRNGKESNRFDARTAWPNCESISQIRDQGQCGDCWAVSSASAITDRTCIASNQTINPILSALDIISCRDSGDVCDGQWPLVAWNYWVNSGLVTGGEEGTDGTCEPYDLPSSSTPSCPQTCADGYATNYDDDKHFGSSAYGVKSKVAAIQKEIMTHGPVVAAFDVYWDFDDYEEGVYYKGYAGNTSYSDDGHVVKLIGWGVENGVDYWLVANSWGTGGWGQKGFGKFRRGTDECNLESRVIAGMPKI